MSWARVMIRRSFGSALSSEFPTSILISRPTRLNRTGAVRTTISELSGSRPSLRSCKGSMVAPASIAARRRGIFELYMIRIDPDTVQQGHRHRSASLRPQGSKLFGEFPAHTPDGRYRRPHNSPSVRRSRLTRLFVHLRLAVSENASRGSPLLAQS